MLFLILELVCLQRLSAGGFFALNGFQIVLFYSTTLALLATAETFVIVTGGIDLSVGFVMGFASVVSAKLAGGLTDRGLAPEAAAHCWPSSSPLPSASCPGSSTGSWWPG